MVSSEFEEINFPMDRRYCLVTLLGLAITGGGALRPVSPALAAPKKAVCVVCNEGEEAVKATATHEGKEHYFCSTGCRDTFLKDPRAYLQPAGPVAAPAFSLKALSGENVSLSDYKGKVVLLDFWATFCGPCVKAMPKLQKLHDEHAARGFAVLGLATDEEGEKLVRPFMAKRKITYPILLDSGAWKAYGVKTLPALFLIDRDGKIVKQYGGKTDPKTIEQDIARLLGA